MDVVDHRVRRNFDAEASNPQEDSVSELPTRPLDGQEGAPAMIQRILSYIQDGTTTKIGVYGMGGVGKTTLMKNIFNQVDDPNYQRIRTSIARDLDISRFDDCGREGRADQLFERLKERKYLLILDDVWASFELRELGIPHPTRENFSKIVMASRCLDVCNAMDADITLKVELMPENDAWKLFLEEAGSMALQPTIEETAREVLRECEGLPLAIRTVGKSLRNESDVDLWRNALRTLQESSSEIAGMKSEVFESLKLSFDFLDFVTKNCFLYLSLFPEKEIIFTYFLSVNWYLEGLIGDVGNFKEVESKGIAIISKLKNACLLESGNCARNIRMRNIVRDMALWITSSEDDPMFLTRTGPRVRLSLMGTPVDKLPENPNCPKLLTLMLEGNQKLTRIPSGFFQFMDSLQILDLGRTGISSLPSSLSSLKNLRALYFYACKMLDNVEVVGNLHNLEVLDLYLTAVKELPQMFMNLQKLKILRLGFTLDLKKIPPNLFACLPLLEVLNMYRSYGSWQTISDGIRSDELLHGLDLLDLANLVNLSALDITINNSNEWLLNSSLVDRLEGLAIENCANFTGISLLQASKLTRLRALSMLSCPELDQIVNREDVNEIIFPDLRLLQLEALLKLEHMCMGTNGHINFQKLEKLTVKCCNRLKNLFSIELLKQLQNLNYFEVSDCSEMEVIIEGQVREEALQFVDVNKCPMLDKLPLDPKQSRRLTRVEKDWLSELKWEDQSVMAAFQSSFSYCD
ncbi:unnamed protein product [Victoria cruziana]